MSIPHLAAAASQCADESGLSDLRRSLATLGRLRAGWQPDESLLADARRVERWSVSRHDDAVVYQFVGYALQDAARTSLIIATVLAIDPDRRWALLAGNRWLRLGGLPSTRPLPDSSDVVRCAETWLVQEIRNSGAAWQYPGEPPARPYDTP